MGENTLGNLRAVENMVQLHALRHHGLAAESAKGKWVLRSYGPGQRIRMPVILSPGDNKVRGPYDLLSWACG